MKKFLVTAMASVLFVCANAARKAAPQLAFDQTKGVAGSVTMPTGQTVHYNAYTKLYYVTNVEDSTYQYMNVYVPDGATQQSPIFLKNNVGGYMPSAPGTVSAGDATGMALLRGYVVAIPGARGRSSYVTVKKKKVYNGKAPAAILDLKAAVRYLRHFDKDMPGDAEKIISDGTSAGGALSALLGASGNNPDYEPLLDKMGAAKERDDIFTAVCFCPISDLSHADIAYEWLYGNTDSRKANDAAHREVTKELAALFPAYINSLGLKLESLTPGSSPKGVGSFTLLTGDNYLDFIKKEIIRSAQIAKDAGADIPDSIGFSFSQERGTFAPVNGGVQPKVELTNKKMGGIPPMGGKRVGEYITDLDMTKYLNYVANKTPLKSAPAFDALGVADNDASGENDEFGDVNNNPVNFTEYSASKNGITLSESIKKNEKLMNAMEQMQSSQSTVAPHWYVRHGAIDRDTAFPIALNLSIKAKNLGKDVNYLLAWNRPHSGDYSLKELFDWLDNIIK